jgi:hypothetical protein
MHFALLQCLDVQSPFLPQGLPGPQPGAGAHAGGAHMPVVRLHTSEPQSLFAPQRAPSVHFVAKAAQAGGSHVWVVGLQTLDAHWPGVVQS